MQEVVRFDHDGPWRVAAILFVSVGDGDISAGVPVVEQPEPAQRGSNDEFVAVEIARVMIHIDGGARAVVGPDDTGWVAEKEDGGERVENMVRQEGRIGSGQDR